MICAWINHTLPLPSSVFNADLLVALVRGFRYVLVMGSMRARLRARGALPTRLRTKSWCAGVDSPEQDEKLVCGGVGEQQQVVGGVLVVR